MGLLSFLRREKRTNLANPSSWFVDWVRGGSEVAAGVPVTPESALRQLAVLACVRLISESVAGLPLHVYKRDGKRREVYTESPVDKLLHDAPNENMTAFAFREVMTSHVCLYGNAYAEIARDGRGHVRRLYPLDPTRITAKYTNGQLVYIERRTTGGETVLQADQVLHLHGLGWDGVSGYSPIALAREAIGLGLAAERFGATWFGNGSRPSGMLKHPGKLSDAAGRRLRDSWQEQYGKGNSNKPAILEEGMEWQQISVPPEDAQFLETRKFQVSEIARLYRVPPHMIGDLDRATFSNIEQQSIEFVVHTLRPWLVRWEQEINRKLFSVPGLYAEHKVDGLLRGDSQARAQFYKDLWNIGVFSINDIRELENMNPVQDGDTRLVPVNMQTLDKALNPPEPAPPPQPPPQEPTDGQADEPDAAGTDAPARQLMRIEALRPMVADAMRRACRKRDLARQTREYSDAEHRQYVLSLLEPIQQSATALSLGFTADGLPDDTPEATTEYILSAMRGDHA